MSVTAHHGSRYEECNFSEPRAAFFTLDRNVVHVERLCPTCEVTLVRTEGGNVRCPICSTVDLCPECLTEIEWDDDIREWDFPCWHPKKD
jgi:endogenous inhibitor of DNA gyrase (YacG/DUF329 family)